MDGAHDMGGAKGFGPWYPSRMNPCFTATGSAAPLADGRDGAPRRLEHRHVALCPREPSAARIISARAISRSGSPGWKR